MTGLALTGTITRADDGSPRVLFDRVYDTDSADLWQAVTDPERIGRWFAPVTGALGSGGTFAIRFDDGDVTGCRVTACDPPRSYAWEWPRGEGASHIVVEVVPAGDRARLRLTHTRVSAEAAPGYAAGWHVFLNRLADHLSGHEVRDTWFEEWPAARDAYATTLA